MRAYGKSRKGKLFIKPFIKSLGLFLFSLPPAATFAAAATSLQDATSLTPPNPNTLEIRYPSQSIPSATVNNEEWSLLPKCPGDPSAGTSTTPGLLCSILGGSACKPICPDLNDSYASYDSTAAALGAAYPAQYCPNECTVTRTETQIYAGSTTRLVDVKAAHCPEGYVQVASYNAQPEIKYNNSPPPAPFPIPDMSTYTNYMSSGYTCSVVGPYNFNAGCIASNNAVATYNVPAPYGSTTVISQAGVTGVGRYQSSTNGGCFTQSSPFCGVPLAGCILSCGSGPSNYICANGTGVIFTMPVTTSFYLYRCTPPAGLYYTSNTLPASVACARVKSPVPAATSKIWSPGCKFMALIVNRFQRRCRPTDIRSFIKSYLGATERKTSATS